MGDKVSMAASFAGPRDDLPPMLVNRTSLGATGVELPGLCFGTSGLGSMPDTYGYSVDAERAHATIRRILESDFPFIDSSRNYAEGRSEERVGEVIRELGGLPAGALLSTKLDREMKSGRFDGARARQSLEQSLEALGVSSVALLHLHDPEHALSIDEIEGPAGALPELFSMKEEGLCHAVGLAAGRIDVMMPLIENWDFDVVITHNRHTLVNRNADPLIELSGRRGVAVINAAPYASGVLAKGVDEHPRYVYQEPAAEQLEPVREIEALCSRYEVPMGALALQFALRDPRIATVLCGVTRPERIEQTLDWAATSIPDELWQAIETFEASTEDPEASRIHTPS